MSVIMTAKKMVINSGMTKYLGWKIPFRATSIMPLEKVTPASIPRLAMIMITCRGATLEPMDEFKKLTASFTTPTIKSQTARPIKTQMENV